MDILVGCDPEVFVRNRNNFQFACAHNLVPGTKEEPFKVPYGAVQVDGMALEFNIDPAKTREEFLRNVKNVYHELSEMAHPYELVPQPTAFFNDQVWADAPPVAKILGCEPDFNAYTGRKNGRPNAKVTFRTASGHVHIGWCEGRSPFEAGHYLDCRDVVKQLDVVLGYQSMDYDDDNQRRQLYGRAGCFRPKSYGVEYRVLSNRWLASDELIQWVFDATQRSLVLLGEGVKASDHVHQELVRRQINVGVRSEVVQAEVNSFFDTFEIPRPPQIKKAA